MSSSPDHQPQLRSDLVHRPIEFGSEQMWVVKDPLSQDYFYFDEREHAILRLLNGRQSVAEIAEHCARMFAPIRVLPAVVHRFVSEAARNGLLAPTLLESTEASRSSSCAPSLSNHSSSSGRFLFARALANPLAIRFRGIHPDRLLERVCKPMKNLPFANMFALWLVAVAMAFLLVLSHFGSFSQNVSVAAGRSSIEFWFTIAVVVAITKVVHELAHAMSAKLLGAECREMGVMLLVGVPCLYCDVTDAWTLKQRWKRVLVSAAGMMAELGLAATAVFLWRICDAGTLRDVCVTVIVVCSVNTLLFNGNPLLRYDGYFILSDLLGIPNLRRQSSRALHSWGQRILCGDSEPSSPHAFSRALTLSIYGILSKLYRVAVVILIATLIFHVLSNLHLQPLAIGFVIALVVTAVFRSAKTLLASPANVERGQPPAQRRWIILGVSALAVLAAVCVPLPRRVVAPMIVMPMNAQPIIASKAGILVKSIDFSQAVSTGDVIAILDNANLSLEVSRKESQARSLSAQIESLEQRRIREPQVAGDIPGIKQQLADTESRLQLLRREQDALTVRAPVGGRVFPPRRRPSQRGHATSRQWSGMPICASNEGARIQRGTVLGHVGDPTQREALAFVDQDSIELIRAKQVVVARSADGSEISGTVDEIDASPASDLPPELLAANRIEQHGLGENAPTLYQVRIRLDDHATPVPVRSTSTVAIHAKPSSLLDRFARALNQSLRL